jgi:hypothetical protein
MATGVWVDLLESIGQQLSNAAKRFTAHPSPTQIAKYGRYRPLAQTEQNGTSRSGSLSAGRPPGVRFGGGSALSDPVGRCVPRVVVVLFGEHHLLATGDQ